MSASMMFPHIAMMAMRSNDGQSVVTHKSFQRSYCGEEFDDYIFQALDSPFPFSPIGAASRDLSLWRNRRLKLHYHGKWREGRVCGFRQYNPTPSTMETCWEMEVKLDTVEPGDQVEFKVVGTVKRNIRTRANEEGAVHITMKSDGENSKEITIKPSDSEDVALRMKLHVHRLNIEGGGTVRFSRENENEALLSLEWLEPATPSVNLFEKILTFDCPCCRATQPVLAAYEPPTKTATAECPVCIETKVCRVLTCDHTVCDECWNSCRHAATRVRLELGDLDEAEVQMERVKRDRLFKKKRNHDGPRNDFIDTFGELVESSDTISGLKQLRWELMVENPGLWAVERVFSRFSDLPMEALQVILAVIETRKAEMVFTENGERIDNSGDAAHFCCYFIAKEYRQNSNYRAAVPWAQLSLYHALHSEGGTEDSNLSGAYLFSSQIYAVADMLTQSLEDFEKCSSLVGGNAQENGEGEARALILGAMGEWTGSSGKLTPGI